MTASLRHFAINADDVERGRAFYEAVFGWAFQPWGPPDFYIIAGAGVGGGLQTRRGIEGAPSIRGFEATMAVEDVEAARAAVEAGGGKVLTAPVHIGGVGSLIWFQDTEGNIAGAMRYDADIPPSLAPAAGGHGAFRHFAINADDVARARGFYERLFGWAFAPWGPPDFHQTRDAGAAVVGALQQRRELVGGLRMNGFEATIGVSDIDATIAAIETAGGRIVMPPYQIERVGELIWFEDSETNVLGAMQYEPGLFP